MNVLVTGINGQLGYDVIKELITSNGETLVTSNNEKILYN